MTPESTGLSSLNLPFWARITGNDGVKFHSWVESQAVAPGSFADLDSARVGTTTVNPIYTTDGSLLKDDAIVLVKRAYFDSAQADWVYVALAIAGSEAVVTITVVTNVCPIVAS